MREVCPNYEVVVLQPQTVTPTHLGSVATITIKLDLTPHLFLPFVWIFPLNPPYYCQPIRSRSLSKSSLICTCSPPPLLARSAAHLDVARTRHPTYSAACLYARAVYLRLPPLPWLFSPHFAALVLRPGPCRPLVCFYIAVTSALLCPRLYFPEFSSKSWHFPFLGLLLGVFLREGERPGCLHSLAVASPGPCSHRYLAVPVPLNFVVNFKPVSFWVHLNAGPNSVIVENLSWPSVFQDTSINHTSCCLVLFSHFPKPGFIGPFKESCRYILSHLLPSEWTWHYVYIIRPCPGFSVIFRIKYFMDEYLIGSMINYFTIFYLSWVGCINPSIMQ